MTENIYDSFQFGLKMNIDSNPDYTMQLKTILIQWRDDENIQFIRLKMDKINYILLAYLRKYN